MKYILSRFLINTDPQSDIIQNIKTGERIKVSKEVLKLLKLFKEPKNLKEALAMISSSQRDTKEIRVFLRQLIKDNVLVSYPESDIIGKSTTTLTDKALV